MNEIVMPPNYEVWDNNPMLGRAVRAYCFKCRSTTTQEIVNMYYRPVMEVTSKCIRCGKDNISLMSSVQLCR